LKFKPGQKWISNAEPELGMGQVMRIEERLVSVFFDMTAEERTYAHAQAPLTRVKFNPGDKIATNNDIVITVTSVVDQEGIYVYHGDYLGTNTAILETELDPNIRFSKAEDRLLTHQLDSNHWFNLRYRTLQQIARLAEAQSRGLYGPRVSLIPHQLYIANEIAQRFAPRVLLADEVGLGKTIEAGLILHQQLQTSRAQRVLIIVPEALTFQWFVELIRRFNLQFTVLDEERCIQIEQDNASEFEEDATQLDNPFDAQQLMLCSLPLFTHNIKRLEQVMDTDWDLVVVDEAHHLRWEPDDASIEYQIIESISKISKGLLLLTATPEQLGRAGHFARLRLLDPNRFHSYEEFLEEESRFEDVAESVRLLLEGSPEEQATARASMGSHRNDDDLVQDLLDRHGTGRVLFRNVRSSVKGFPNRALISYPLKKPDSYDNKEFYPETFDKNWAGYDPRVQWLIELLTEHREKYLVICAHQDVAIAIDKKIKETTAIRSTVFHEGMDLVARDRSAHHFAETLKGAQVMICSEIGSEGRNFQFANQLVLFDLPLGPDSLEQRIGRLDRIGQKSDITIHVPFLQGSAMEKLFTWFHHGLDLFSAPNPVAQALFDEQSSQLLTSDLKRFIVEAKEANKERRDTVNRGRDRLLELNSHRPSVSAELIKDIHQNEGGETLEAYMEASFEIFGLESEPLGDNVISVKPTETMLRNFSVSMETMDHFHYPELPEDGIAITYDRQTGLTREDVSFFTWENPIVQQALDIVISDVSGNSTMIAIKHPLLKPGTLLVETLYVVDCIAPAILQADRYLPPSVVRIVITPALQNIASRFPFQDFVQETLEVPTATLNQILDSQLSGIKDMLEKAKSEANEHLKGIQEIAATRTSDAMDMEYQRLKALQAVNPNVREEELSHLKLTKESLQAAISAADMRLEAIRVIVAA